MGKRMSVIALPKEVLDELRLRLMQSNFSNYEEHSTWLASKGFSISKSAIHRYATEYATSVMSAKDVGASLSPVEARLRCLEVAATLNQSSSSAELIKHADDLLKWVYTY
jgi:hypothetical protein